LISDSFCYQTPGLFTIRGKATSENCSAKPDEKPMQVGGGRLELEITLYRVKTGF
jgi:hypothetical protein